MLRPKQNSARRVSLAKVSTRAVVAACLTLSFFASLAPLRVSADAGAMACCAGKAGHCRSGLIAKRQTVPVAKPEPMCGLKPRGTDEARTIVVTDGITGDEISAEISGDGITILATSSEDTESGTNERTTESNVSTESSQPEATAALQSASITKPCPADCSAGTTGVVRQPRPRERAVLVSGSRGTSLDQGNWKSRSPLPSLASSATLKRTRPRGPPPSS